LSAETIFDDAILLNRLYTVGGYLGLRTNEDEGAGDINRFVLVFAITLEGRVLLKAIM